jgi:hypothetical protein
MSTDVYDLTGDKTMNANTNVKLANDDVWSVNSTGATRALTEGNGAGETAYRRSHAPRSGKPKNAAFTGLHFDISSTSERSSATRRLRVSECARPSLRPLERIRASYRRRIGYSPANQVSEIRRMVWSQDALLSRVTRGPLRRSILTVSASLYLYCRPKSTQLRSNSSPDSAQTKSIRGPIPRAVHGLDLATLQLASPTMHVPKQLTGSANDRSAHQTSLNKH